MNSFCLKCTGGDKSEVRGCDDINCPFWQYRRSDLPHQVERKEEVKLCVPFDGSIA